MICLAMVFFCAAAVVHAQDAASLKARHEALRAALSASVFKRPLVLESSETTRQLQGEIYAEIAQPYAAVGRAMQDIGNWCDLLILHLNVKGCLAAAPGQLDRLRLNVGRKSSQPLEDSYAFDFRHRVVKSDPDYLQVELTARDGPIGTSHYRMLLEIVAVAGQRSFLHLSYSYDYGLAARVAMRGYLSTSGRDKRGFSVVGRQPDGGPVFVGGTRGVIERNTMRYFIAIEAYLGALSTPAPQRQQKRLEDWFTGVERYPEQLHELERGEYLAMKRAEIQRMQDLRAPAAQTKPDVGSVTN